MSEQPITPISGEPTRFHVASDSGGVPYLVDLRPYDGNGECGCPHFTARLAPKLAAGERDFTEDQKLRCKHLKRAHIQFGCAVVKQIDQNQ